MTDKNYLSNKLNKKEYIIYVFLYEFAVGTVSHFFYDSSLPAVFMNIFLKRYLKFICNFLQKKREARISLEFLDMISSVSASLSTGYSLENAVTEAYNTVSNIYGVHSIISQELVLMQRKLLLNIPVESIFEDLGNRTGIDDIQVFSEIIKIAKKGGGDMISVIKSTVDSIRNKIEVKEEISSIVASKRYEQLIMSAMPFAIFIYIDFTQPDFFSPLYHNTLGILISSICLIIYFCSILLSKKLLEIEV